ncbi:MAG: hypothetical protein PVG35_09725 [Desulfobacterales bacterium]|jgi:hypothetical protein
MAKNDFRIFPAERMQVDFPWQIWAVGWLCIFKGILWLAYEPNLSDNLMTFFGLKYLFQILPMIIFGIGIWNKRRWAVWGAAAIGALNLILFFVTPHAFSAMVVQHEAFIWSVLLSAITLLCNGPVGDLLVLIATPSLLKHTKTKN